ncbi:pro-glucagon isoform X2 [Bombina bombina]|uniref:pro-glucagon isoform X2 n=1 Tax=Bombina bombina TaxID=8345 RepID=UPI00235AECEB|nr:pro-glucagon isoform X2 [Bombina bombina]
MCFFFLPCYRIIMKSMYCIVGLLFMLLQRSWQSPIQEAEDRSKSVKAARSEPLEEPEQLNEVKRHSQGTFTSDYSKYLDSRRAQDFVQWLMNSKRSGGLSRRNADYERHAEGTYTNDVTKYLEDKAAKEFIDWLIKGGPQKEKFSRRNAIFERHAEGTFTNDMTSYLEEKAAKEFVDWLIKGRPKRNFSEVTSAEEMGRRHADGSFTNDINKVLDVIAAQEFIDWIINTKVTERDLLEGQ